jgi:hypothetical protein
MKLLSVNLEFLAALSGSLSRRHGLQENAQSADPESRSQSLVRSNPKFRLRQKNFNSDASVSMTSKIKHHPRWCVIAGVFLPTHPSVHTSVHEPFGHLRREQDVI